MRLAAPDLPAALDKAVLRGLERDPASAARPRRVPGGAVALRAGQALHRRPGHPFRRVRGRLRRADAPGPPPLFLTVAATGGGDPWDAHIRPVRFVVQQLAGVLLWGAYFGVCEALWGCTPGKRWLGLRVYRARAVERPGAVAVALRTFLFFFLLNLGSIALGVLFAVERGGPGGPAPRAANPLRPADPGLLPH